MRDFLPMPDASLRSFALAFAEKIAAAPGEYGLENAEAAEIREAVEAFVDAFTLARDPATRLKGNIVRKDRTKAAVIEVIRRYARQIKANPDIPNERKVDLGVRPNKERTRPTAPVTSPHLNIRLVQPRRHVLGYTDHSSAGGAAKPAGVLGLQLFCHVGDAPPAEPIEARFESFVTRQPYAVDFEAEQIGKTAFYYARWQTPTGKTGPWSPVLKMTVAG